MGFVTHFLDVVVAVVNGDQEVFQQLPWMDDALVGDAGDGWVYALATVVAAAVGDSHQFQEGLKFHYYNFHYKDLIVAVVEDCCVIHVVAKRMKYVVNFEGSHSIERRGVCCLHCDPQYPVYPPHPSYQTRVIHHHH